MSALNAKRVRPILFTVLGCVFALAMLVGRSGRVGAQTARRAETQAASADACIAPATEKRATECPGINVLKGKRGKSDVPVSHDQVIKSKKQAPGKGMQKAPEIQMTAAQRSFRGQRQARAESLLVREIELTERLFQRTPQSDPRRPDILFRLAEDYVEMQQGATAGARGLDEPIFQAQKAKNAAKVQQLQRQQQEHEQRVTRYRQEAIRQYARLVQQHPNYASMDQVLFYLAFALEELQQFDRAREVYYRLIKAYPTSRFIPNALLSFAEYYFAGGDMNSARQFYDRVLSFGIENNQVYGYALYKQAWCLFNLQDFRGSLNKFVEVIEFATQHPDVRDAAALARQARVEMVGAYGQTGAPASRAFDFFRRYSGTEDMAYTMLERLGELFFDTGHWPEAIAVYHDLMNRRPQSDRLCEWQSRVTNAVVSSRPKAQQVEELVRQTQVMELFRTQRQPAERITTCRSSTASIMVDLATHWHREAVGTEASPGTNDRNTMRAAATLYNKIVERFSDLDTMAFENIDRRDWPNAYKIKYWYAELLFKMDDWERCGTAFDAVVEADANGAYVADAAYAAVLCYNNLYQAQNAQDDRTRRGPRTVSSGGASKAAGRPSEFAPRELTKLENGMLNAYTRYVCYVGQSNPNAEDLVTIKYRRARIYYESNHFEEAAVIFRDIAWRHRDSDMAEYAANLYLDSLNVLGEQSTPPRPACYARIVSEVPAMLDMFCQGDAAATHADLCTDLRRLRCDTLYKAADAYKLRGEYKNAARAYLGVVRECPNYRRLDDVLWNVSLMYEAARLLGRSIKVRQFLIDKVPNSPHAKRALFLIGANYHALTVYQRAADYYEQFATQYPGEMAQNCSADEKRANICTNAPEALQNATFFRLGLGQDEKAVDDARLFEKNYKNRRPAEVSQVVYSIGAIYERQRNWQKVVDHYQNYLRQYGRAGKLDEQVQARMAIAHAYWERNQRKQAEPEARAALAAWDRAHGTLRGDNAEDTEARLAKAKNAVAQARFYLAELAYNEFLQLRAPEYTPPKTKARGKKGAAEATKHLTKWFQADFKRWFDRKSAALDKAQKLYVAAADLHVPNWEIAGAARVGDMNARVVDAIRGAPVPPCPSACSEITEREEKQACCDDFSDTFREELEKLVQPQINATTGAFEYCLHTATKVRWFNEWSRLCERELNKLNPRQYPVASEVRAEPGYSRIDVAWVRPILQLETAAERAEREEASRDPGSRPESGSPAGAVAAPAPAPAKAAPAKAAPARRRR